MKKINFDRKARKQMRHRRLIKKLQGFGNTKPRLIVTKTNANLYAQIINDENQTTLVYVSSLQLKKPGNVETAKIIGEEVAKKAKEANITEVVFDRNGQKFHGQVKAIADAARDGGLKI
jgi:large subunit ribosomal protein L18